MYSLIPVEFSTEMKQVSPCVPKPEKFWGQQNLKKTYERVTSEKELITVMGTFPADGKGVSPMIIFPYKKMPKAIVESVPENWAIGRSDSG